MDCQGSSNGLLCWYGLVRLDTIFLLPGPAPPAAPKGRYKLDLLKKFGRGIPFSRTSADRAAKLTIIRVVRMKNRHLPSIPSICFLSHNRSSLILNNTSPLILTPAYPLCQKNLGSNLQNSFNKQKNLGSNLQNSFNKKYSISII